jgi:hypothetical protein
MIHASHELKDGLQPRKFPSPFNYFIIRGSHKLHYWMICTFGALSKILPISSTYFFLKTVKIESKRLVGHIYFPSIILCSIRAWRGPRGTASSTLGVGLLVPWSTASCFWQLLGIRQRDARESA